MSELEEVTAKRDAARQKYDALRKRRLDEFMVNVLNYLIVLTCIHYVLFLCVLIGWIWCDYNAIEGNVSNDYVGR